MYETLISFKVGLSLEKSMGIHGDSRMSMISLKRRPWMILPKNKLGYIGGRC